MIQSIGLVSIDKVPADRWDVRRFFDTDKEVAGKSYSSAGAFIKQPIDEFDAAFFGISPREAAPMDPQQRFLCSEFGGGHRGSEAW